MPYWFGQIRDEDLAVCDLDRWEVAGIGCTCRRRGYVLEEIEQGLGASAYPSDLLLTPVWWAAGAG